MNQEEAQKLVEVELENSKDKYDPIDCVVLEEQTVTRDWGWVFFYQSKAYIESGDSGDMLYGNAPFIVNRASGELVVTGTAWPIEKYIEDYETQLLSGA